MAKKNLIYQYWDGNVLIGVKAGVKNMKAYADRIGADYLFEDNPKYVKNLGSYSPHYGAFKPVFTPSFYEKYDNILFADTDVFAVDGLTESIFDGFDADLGICTEPFQPKARRVSPGSITTERDEIWAKVIETTWNVKMPRTEEGLLKVYNSGVVLYSNKGMAKAREKWIIPFKKYVDIINSTSGLVPFYTCDQPYLHAMLKVANMDYIELDNEWNRYVHYLNKEGLTRKPVLDPRTENTKFVHIQVRGADHYTAEKLRTITNRPVNEWGNDKWGNKFVKGDPEQFV